jgi:very-short-patch-repair endonuclease
VNPAIDKGVALLAFLKAAATLRRRRVSSYGTGDKIIWFVDVPRDRAECRSPFLTDKPGEFADLWLEVRKKRMPTRPAPPEAIAEWVRADDLERADKEPELRPEITVLVEQQVSDADALPESQRSVVEKRPEVHRLSEHPEIEDGWLEYLVNKWEPWAQEMRRWQEVQRVYEDLDFMRRRLEESEERYELLLAVGLLQWRDPTGTSVKRHLLTAPAEISLDAARGILTVVPAASFDRFRVELDMLELHDQPRLNGVAIEDQLDELDVQAWDTARLAQILREIANRLRSDAQVDEAAFKPAERSEESPRLSYAPALVLRERRPTSYEDLVRKFLEIATGTRLEDTKPWRRFLLEGETPGGASDRSGFGPNGNEPGALQLDRYLFPLPANDEQRQIVHRLQVEPCVLVKGPPGTGKSHTIANLICHLLASGNRVLVTAHAPKALAVLRGLLPDDVRDLCVTTLGSSREDQRLLEESVRGILRRKNEWRGAEWAQQIIDQTEKRLQQIEGELATVERRLREFREAETHSHTLPGGYQGTAAQIARKVHQEREVFSWFPDGGCDNSPFPLEPADVSFLVEVHGQLTKEKLEELRLELGDLSLPDPDEFEKLVDNLLTAEDSADSATNAAAAEKLEVLRNRSLEALERLQAALTAMEEHAVRAVRVLGDLTEEILADLVVGNVDRWARLVSAAVALLNTADTLRKRLGTTRIEMPADAHRDRLRTDAERRRIHFERGGHRGFSVLAPRVVRETRYVEERCLVDGQEPREPELLAKVVDFLQLEQATRDFSRLWPAHLPAVSDRSQAATAAADVTNELRRLLKFFETLDPESLACVPMEGRARLASQNERMAWLRGVKAESARQQARTVTKSFQEVLDGIRACQSSGLSHPCLENLAQAAQSKDTHAWRVASTERERLRTEGQRFRRYKDLEEKLDRSCPGMEAILRNTTGNPEWTCKLRELEGAWTWSSARAWLRSASDAAGNKELVREFHRLQEKGEKATEELASIRAWRAFFERLDDATVQSLNAWTKAVDRIGKGTGKHAYRHRRAARQYLMDCVPRIPAWVMPLHKLWDTVDAQAGMFDTVIVDEASQAGIESLALLLLAKRIVVVGDDKQNSPEAVGVLEDDIARLAREHLSQFRFRDEFRPDTSLFDHAERAFGRLISLREHFRCVPEIIRFSNDLCYRDAPLIPLRQAPPNRLPPIMPRYISEGACEGEGQRIRNRAEAEALVEVIQRLVEDDAYESKTIGVIALQGHAQAELIENLLAQRLDPQTIEERRLRCGEPATFQGDQRDIILLSLVIAPNVQYRALSRLPDQRRFNVAMSRARDQVWLFHSVRQHDLSPEDLRRKLLSFFDSPGHGALDRLAEDLDHLEREARRPRRRGNQPEPYESWFELDVALELLRRKYAVRPQVEIAKKRIDLVVDGIDARLAVECDGDEWHGAEQYEHDMARQRQLERAGWTFARVRESDFYVDSQSATSTITDACEELGVYPLDRTEEARGQSSVQEPDEQIAAGANHAESIIESRPGGEEQTTDADVSTAAYGPFSGYSATSRFPDPRETSPANVRAVLRQIIETDGPLTRSSVYRLYVEGCSGLQRVGKVVRQALSRALGAMLRAGEIDQEDELRDGSPEGQVVRLAGAGKVRVRPAGSRELLEIPPSELLAVLGRLFPANPGASEDDEALLRGVLEHYGFSRLTRPRRDYLAKVLRLRNAKEKEFGVAGGARNDEAV